MIKYKYFVHLEGWSDGGFEDTSFAINEAEARNTIATINDEYGKNGKKIELHKKEEVDAILADLEKAKAYFIGKLHEFSDYFGEEKFPDEIKALTIAIDLIEEKMKEIAVDELQKAMK